MNPSGVSSLNRRAGDAGSDEPCLHAAVVSLWLGRGIEQHQATYPVWVGLLKQPGNQAAEGMPGENDPALRRGCSDHRAQLREVAVDPGRCGLL